MVTMVQIEAGNTPKNYRYNTAFLPCFLSFVGNLSKMQPTNDPGVTVIAVALTGDNKFQVIKQLAK